MNNDKSIQQTPKAILKSMKIIHPALLVGQILFAGVIFSIKDKAVFLDIKNDKQDVVFYIVPLFAIACIIISIFIFKQKTDKIPYRNTLAEKLKSYQSALITRFALLEGASLFGIAYFSTTYNLFFLLVSAGIMLYFLTLRPNVDKTTDDLKLSYEEKIELEA